MKNTYKIKLNSKAHRFTFYALNLSMLLISGISIQACQKRSVHNPDKLNVIEKGEQTKVFVSQLEISDNEKVEYQSENIDITFNGNGTYQLKRMGQFDSSLVGATGSKSQQCQIFETGTFKAFDPGNYKGTGFLKGSGFAIGKKYFKNRDFALRLQMDRVESLTPDEFCKDVVNKVNQTIQQYKNSIQDYDLRQIRTYMNVLAIGKEGIMASVPRVGIHSSSFSLSESSEAEIYKLQFNSDLYGEDSFSISSNYFIGLKKDMPPFSPLNPSVKVDSEPSFFTKVSLNLEDFFKGTFKDYYGPKVQYGFQFSNGQFLYNFGDCRVSGDNRNDLRDLVSDIDTNKINYTLFLNPKGKIFISFPIESLSTANAGINLSQCGIMSLLFRPFQIPTLELGPLTIKTVSISNQIPNGSSSEVRQFLRKSIKVKNANEISTNTDSVLESNEGI